VIRAVDSQLDPHRDLLDVTRARELSSQKCGKANAVIGESFMKNAPRP
jgi:hypothetical protein